MGVIRNLVLRYKVSVDYRGDVKGGKPHGYGRASYNNGSWYDGEWINGKQHGYGKYYYPDGTLRYEGHFEKGLRHGLGTDSLFSHY